MTKEKLIAFLSDVCIIVPSDDDEPMQVDFVDESENSVYCTGEESGEQYYIDLADFNVDDYMFYKLQRVEPPK